MAYVRFAAAHASRVRLFSAAEIGEKTAHPGLVEAFGRTFGVLLATMRACQKAGVVRDGDLRRLSLTAWATVHGLATLLVEDQLAAAGFVDHDMDTLAPAVARSLFRGLRA